MVSEEQLQLPCQIPQRSKGPVHRLRGPLIPLETPISTPVKDGAHQPLNPIEQSTRQDRNNNENSILVNNGIHLYTSTYQPQNPLQAQLSKTTSIHFFQLPGERILISRGNPIRFPRQTLRFPVDHPHLRKRLPSVMTLFNQLHDQEVRERDSLDGGLEGAGGHLNARHHHLHMCFL